MSMLAELQTPSIVTTDFLYLRFIGDRSIQEKDFGRMQVDRVFGRQKLADNIKMVEDERIKLSNDRKQSLRRVRTRTVNIFRNILVRCVITIVENTMFWSRYFKIQISCRSSLVSITKDNHWSAKWICQK